MKQEIKDKIDKKVRNKLRFFLVMFFIFFGLTIYYTIKDLIPLPYTFPIFLLGFLTGIILSRIQKITYNKELNLIVKEFDLISGILLFFLILLILFKQQLILKFIHLPKISAIVFALNTGIMLGRVWRIRKKIIKEFKIQEFLTNQKE